MKQLAALLLLAAAPALAATSDDEQGQTARAFAAPSQLSAPERENYRLVFTALRASDWAGAAGRLDEMRPGLLHDIARAQLYTMPGSPRVEAGPLVLLLNRAPDLPQAPALARLASSRGVQTLPSVPEAQRLYALPGQPRRARPRPIRGDAVADQLEPLISPLIRDDKPVEAEALLATRSIELTPEARAAFQQRIAWVYYLNGNDRDARRLADLCRTAPGDYALQAEWVAGLAAWRMADYADAAAHFTDVATRSTDPELVAAGHYWPRAPIPQAVTLSASRPGCAPPPASARLSTACSPRARSGCRARPPISPPSRRVTGMRSRMSATPASPSRSPKSARPGSPRTCSAIRPRSAIRATIRP